VQVGLAQVLARQVGLAEVGFGPDDVDLGGPRAEPLRPPGGLIGDRPGEIGPGEVRPREIGPAEVGGRQVGVLELGAGEA
jgi:hypothetical protein